MVALARLPAVVGVAGLTVSLIGIVLGAAFGVSRGGFRLLVPSVVLAGLFSGLLLGAVRAAEIEDSALLRHEGETAEFELVISGAVRRSAGWQSAIVTVTRCDSQESVSGEKAWLEVPPEFGEQTLREGLILRCRATIEAPEEGTDSGYDQRGWLLQQGVCVVLTATDPDALSVVGSRGGFAGRFDQLRLAAREHLAMGPSNKVNEVLKGVVTGDTAGIDEAWLEAFRRSGTAHMLCVSGLHVASLAVIIIGLARLLRAPRWAGFVMAAVAALLMIPFVGPSPPVIRAATMVVIVLFGRWVGRGRDQWQVLALAAVVLLTMNPFTLFDVGFQLSFCALGGIMTLVAPLQSMFKRLPSAMAGNLAVSLAAGLGTAPVALVQFGRTSLISPLANMLVVPGLPVIVGLGMASVFAGFIWHGLSTALDTTASLPMMWTVLVSRASAVVPVLESGDVGRALAALLGGAMAIPVALASMGRSMWSPFGPPLPFLRRALQWVGRHRPRRRGLACAVGCVCVVSGLALGLAAWSAGEWGVQSVQAAVGSRGWPQAVELRVLDVGQGSAVLVRTPGHHALLFDGGPEGCDLAGQLRSLGVRRLDVAVVSHPHADHFAGLLEALPDLKVGTLVDHVRITRAEPRAPPSFGEQAARSSDEAQQYLELRRLLESRGCDYVLAANGDTVSVDGVTVKCFAPSEPLRLVEGPDARAPMGGMPNGDELNAASLVVALSADSMDVIIPGDAEAGTLAEYGLPAAEIMVVPHHGSRGAVTERVLRDLGVRVGVVSVGARNQFGHPDPETVALLEGGTETAIRTDLAGWVCCRSEKGQISITTERTPFW